MSDNNPEKIESLFNQMVGAIKAAKPDRYQVFNEVSNEIWTEIGGFVCAGSVTINAIFDRTRRPSDFHTLPAEQAQTSLFVDHEIPENVVELKEGLFFGIISAPQINDTDFIFSLMIPDQVGNIVVRWPLLSPRPKLELDMSRLPELQ